MARKMMSNPEKGEVSNTVRDQTYFYSPLRYDVDEFLPIRHIILYDNLSGETQIVRQYL